MTEGLLAAPVNDCKNHYPERRPATAQGRQKIDTDAGVSNNRRWAGHTGYIYRVASHLDTHWYVLFRG